MNSTSALLTLVGSFTNSGTLNNAGFIQSAGGALTNSGTVIISTTGAFDPTIANYTQTAGSTVVDGTITTYSGAILNIQGGTLSGSGTINGNVVLGGTLAPGDAPGTLTINGTYEQTGSGVYDELISSTANGLLSVSGSVTLDAGTSLDISLLGGFDPSNGTSFDILDYGTESGTFTISDPFFDDGTQEWVITSYDGGAAGNEIVLTAEATTPVATPEPSSLALLTIGLGALVLFVRRETAMRRRLA